MTLCKMSSAFLTLALAGLGAVSQAQMAVLQDRVAATEPVSFSVFLPLRNHAQMEKDLADMHTPGMANFQRWMTPEEFNAKYGPTAAQMQAVQTELAGYGLQTTVVSGRMLHVTGPGAAVEQALSTVLKHSVSPSGKKTVAATQPIVVPGALAETNALVTGLSGLTMRTHSHRLLAKPAPDNRYSTTGGYWFDDLKQAYAFPSYQTYTGKGVTIGILMSSGLGLADMNKYFTHEKLATPNFSVVPVDGGAPFDPKSDGTFEANLDLQQSGGMAPDANIVLYNIPTLDQNYIFDGLSKILADNKADVVSMSFGLEELYYTAAYNGGTDYTSTALLQDELFAQGNAQGITFVASSGDYGGPAALPLSCLDGAPNCGMFIPSASFPATSPHVVAVGGTNLVTAHTVGSLDSTYVLEEAYGDPLKGDPLYGTSATGLYWGSGGGDSIFFKRPDYQIGTNTGNARARTIPDLSGHMGGCPGGVLGACNPDDSFDYEVLGLSYYGVIGTSASAPDFAGLTALAIQRFGQRMGNENYYVYGLARSQKLGLLSVYNQNIPANNGYYTNGNKPGYNRVLGNGTVKGAQFLLAPNPAAVAGIPQTSTNP